MEFSKRLLFVYSFGGVLLVSLADKDGTNQPPSPPALPLPGVNGNNFRMPNAIIGDMLALLSALFYALYVILLKVRIRSESRVNMQLFFGFVGLFNIVSCWPIGLVLHFTGVERFEFPTSSKAWVAVLVNVRASVFSSCSLTDWTRCSLHCRATFCTCWRCSRRRRWW